MVLGIAPAAAAAVAGALGTACCHKTAEGHVDSVHHGADLDSGAIFAADWRCRIGGLGSRHNLLRVADCSWRT